MALVVISPARQTRPVVSRRLAGDAGVGVLRQDGIEDAVGDLVGHLVGMAHRDGFAGEQVAVVMRHGRKSPSGRSSMCQAGDGREKEPARDPVVLGTGRGPQSWSRSLARRMRGMGRVGVAAFAAGNASGGMTFDYGARQLSGSASCRSSLPVVAGVGSSSVSGVVRADRDCRTGRRGRGGTSSRAAGGWRSRAAPASWGIRARRDRRSSSSERVDGVMIGVFGPRHKVGDETPGSSRRPTGSADRPGRRSSSGSRRRGRRSEDRGGR